MSVTSESTSVDRLRLPSWTAPRDAPPDGSDPAPRDVRLIELIVLVLLGLVLVVATVYDLGRQAHINVRLTADLKTWRTYTGRNLKHITLEQPLLGGTTDRACGFATPGAHARLCLILVGPVVSGRRKIVGGYYVPTGITDRVSVRSGCFGAAVCPPGAPKTPPA